MKLETQHRQFDLPDGMRRKLTDFRRHLRAIKLAEGIFAAVFGLAVSYCFLFVLDRFWETPHWVRWLILLTGSLGLVLALPFKLYRWFWRHRRLEQVARLLRRAFPRIGDQLLGVIQLAKNEEGQERSVSLVRAAMTQVDEATRDRDFRKGVPDPRHWSWGMAALAFVGLATAAFCLVPAAGWNTFLRWAMPGHAVERYTFAQLDPLPEKLFVPYAEKFSIAAFLQSESVWKPDSGSARYLNQLALHSPRVGEGFHFEVPPQRDPGELVIAVGDDRALIEVEPLPRPELEALTARIELPDYLQHDEAQLQEVSSGALSVLSGSRVQISARTSRDLLEAKIDSKAATVFGDTIRTPWLNVEEPQSLTFFWSDQFGLSAKESFALDLRVVEDEAPTIQSDFPKKEQVVLDTEVVAFEVLATDDYGVRQVGLAWEGLQDSPKDHSSQSGEMLAAAGGPEAVEIEARVAFSPADEGLRPQILRVRAFVEDYFPGRERVYSAYHTLRVLSPEDHAIWLSEQLERWRQQALQTYERERQLNNRNKELRALDPAKLDEPGTRREIARQAAAERANARQLTGLMESGESLVQQAARNPDFEAEMLERWAETLQSLKDIAENRMPSVADLLQSAADAEPAGSGMGGGKGRLSLPTTSVAGSTPSAGGERPPMIENLNEAVEEQRKLLEEFSKVSKELNEILGDLEGSTFVKRLKAASREQMSIAGDLNRDVLGAFGIEADVVPAFEADAARSIVDRQIVQSENIYQIEEDLEAYSGRMSDPRFSNVVRKMKTSEVASEIAEIGVEASRDNFSGRAMATAEFWADALDRWAEELVGPEPPTGEPPEPGENESPSLPPGVVLEVMRLLRSEMELRDSTRSLNEARSVLSADRFASKAAMLAKKQGEYSERVGHLATTISDLPGGATNFRQEIALLQKVAGVMSEAEAILAEPETGPRAIAAETEVIELLLQAQRTAGGGGGGGSNSPGTGG
ncbi:MAG: hypothetical protein AAGA96_03070, partial [Verrucomicrobiota bacterium]